MNVIKVYGSGCANCKRLEAMCTEVIQENNFDASIKKVTDLQEIMKTGILSTPGLEILRIFSSFFSVSIYYILKHYITLPITKNFVNS